MKLPRLALLLTVVASPLVGCGSHKDVPHMVGREALDELPKDEHYKPSPKAKKLRVDAAANSMELR